MSARPRKVGPGNTYVSYTAQEQVPGHGLFHRDRPGRDRRTAAREKASPVERLAAVGQAVATWPMS